MNKKEVDEFFACLGEIWRDITAIEFLMRTAIAKYDNHIDRFPQPPYTKGKIYDNPPKSFLHYSFEIIVQKFNTRFPEVRLPNEIIDLRNAFAHGVIFEVENSGINELVKFKEKSNGKIKQIEIEFSLKLDQKTLHQLRQSIKELRGYIIEEINKSA